MGQVHFSVDGHIALIELDNPERHNAVDAAMREGLEAAYHRVETDDAVRVAIITGREGTSFCAGGSIDGYLELGTFGPGGVELPKIPRPYPARKPYIAAMRGFALGGGFALAVSCDLRIAGRDARMGPTGLRLGSVQGAQTISRLTRLIGASRAMEVLLLSKRLTGEEAATNGLVQALVEDDQVMARAMEWAETIAGFSPWGVQMTKQLVYEGQHLPLDEAVQWEDRIAAEAYRRPEALEGFSAFKEKRKPRFP